MSSKGRLNLSLDFRLITIILLVVIAAMLALWRPWSDGGVSDRTIEVTGEATVSAVPDEYVFYPVYQFRHEDQQAAIDEMSAKSDELVADLEELGVSENQIKTSANGYDRGVTFPEADGDTRTTYTLTLTVTVSDSEMAQKVQDYLTGTGPTGAVSPQATFSDDRRKELEAQARDEATKDARAKADQSAANLGFKVGSVKSVTDGAGFGGVQPLIGRAEIASDSSARLEVRPGEQELNYTVTVTYYVR